MHIAIHRSLGPVCRGLALAAALALPAYLQAAEVAGVKLDDKTQVAGKELTLNGAGVRTRAIFKVYVMGLYLGTKAGSADAVLASTGPRRITLVMLRDVSGDDLGQAFITGINNNSDKNEKGKVTAQLTKLGEVFINTGELKKGDILQIDWVPDKGTAITLNGKSISDPLPDLAFYNAMLRIWLGDKPADASLKTGLLGG